MVDFISQKVPKSLKMNAPKKTFIIRHRRENLKKCSLRGLEASPDFLFFEYPGAVIPAIEKKIILTLDAPPLTYADHAEELLLIDATWRLAKKMEEGLCLPKEVQKRSLPHGFQTAYPRRQTGCSDPERGLASIEALYVAFFILKRDVSDLLKNYYWKESFLEKNGLLL